MKKQFNHLKLLLPALFIVPALSSSAQVNQEFTFELKTTAANVIASRALIDLPALSGNTAAIIVATPVGNTKTANPQPTGAWYYNGKWNLFNTNHAVLPIGLTYKLTYFLKADANQFLHTVTQQNLSGNGSSINHPALNNNPNAQFAFFQNHAPGVRPAGLNGFEEKVVYNTAAKKWFISNIGSQPLTMSAVYNIVIYLPTPVTTILLPGVVVYPNPVGPKPDTSACKCPSSLPPNGLASGDLRGMYPDPMVTKILGRFISNTAPAIGQLLKWNGNEWAPSDDNVATTPPAPPPESIQTFFKNDNTPKNPGEAWLTDSKPNRILTTISHSIELVKKSRLVISAKISAHGDLCPLGCTDGEGHFVISINNVEAYNSTSRIKGSSWWTAETAFISNYMVDLEPGIHNIQFIAHHTPGKSSIIIFPAYSSIMVIPLQ